MNLGIAVDVEKSDGSRTLMVVAIKNAEAMDFRQFVEAYETLIRRVRSQQITADDLSGVTVTLTNPGGFGTLQSVPRLMPGQGLIVGVGTIAHPTEFQAADPRQLAELGISKVITLTSTYDHRIIQGAESGLFLKKVNELLVGEDEFYKNAFRSMGVPYEAVQWRRDVMPLDHTQAMVEKQVQVNTLINMHRVRGHLIADLDPLRLQEPHTHSELDPATYGLTIWDLDREFYARGIGGIDPTSQSPRMPLGDLLGVLRDAYCRTIGVEYMHIQEPEEKAWIQRHVEGPAPTWPTTRRPTSSTGSMRPRPSRSSWPRSTWARNGSGSREPRAPSRFSMPSAPTQPTMRLDSIVLGMAHRGRLNVLVNIVGKTYGALFAEFEGGLDENAFQGSGDVKYHLGQTGEFTSRTGNTFPSSSRPTRRISRPSIPVVLGMARARMDQIHPPGRLPGPAAADPRRRRFRGPRRRGRVAEPVPDPGLQGRRHHSPRHQQPGRLHDDSRPLAQLGVPHRRGQDGPGADLPRERRRPRGLCARGAPRLRLPAALQQGRRHRHVVLPTPRPQRRRRPQLHPAADVSPHRGASFGPQALCRVIGQARRHHARRSRSSDGRLPHQAARALDATRGAAIRAAPQPVKARRGRCLRPIQACRAPHRGVGRNPFDVPDRLRRHPKLEKQLVTRNQMFAGGEVDWALAESLAIGSLLAEGKLVRLAGQDSRRGTFSHRHSTFVCYQTGQEHTPLEQVAIDNDTNLWIYDSLLSEYAALGFEYGYSVVNPKALVIWEAQFGDFMNGAQIIIDQFLVAAEDKWGQHSGLVMLLPHGYEGQGPEHSSARIERFLLLAADSNMTVLNTSTSAQYFHALRRQAHAHQQRPLILFTPKSLLRARAARSPVTDLVDGRFQLVLSDPGVVDPSAVSRVILTSGKISHEAIAERDRIQAPAAVERVEQLYPWPFDAVAEAMERYSNADEIVWLQEEPENMGGWNSVKGRLYEAHGHTHRIRRVSRPESASPASGSGAVHAWEQADLLTRVFGPL